MAAFKQVRLKHEEMIAKLRASQRQQTNQVTRQMQQEGQRKQNLFCKMCKLVYHHNRNVHNASKEHRAIFSEIHKKCDVCDIQFNARMAYEKHIGSIVHLGKLLKGQEEISVADGGDTEMDFNPEDFVTLDEVGDDEGDKEDEMEEENIVENEEEEKVALTEETEEKLDQTESAEKHEMVEEDQSKPSEENDVKTEEAKIVKVEEDVKVEEEPERPVGQDYIRQVVMYFCDLCHKYLPKVHHGDIDELIDSHCVSPVHQNAFIKKEAEKRLEEEEALTLLVKVRNFQLAMHILLH